MKPNRTITALALATGALIAAVSPAGAAGAAGTDSRGSAVMASAPDVISGPSNGYTVFYRGKDEATGCKRGNLCLSVWDTTRSPDQWKVFSFWKCGVYNVARWEGGGYWENNQTDGARGTFYSGANGTGNSGTTAKPYSHGTYGWSPINSVRPC